MHLPKGLLIKLWTNGKRAPCRRRETQPSNRRVLSPSGSLSRFMRKGRKLGPLWDTLRHLGRPGMPSAFRLNKDCFIEGKKKKKKFVTFGSILFCCFPMAAETCPPCPCPGGGAGRAEDGGEPSPDGSCFCSYLHVFHVVSPSLSAAAPPNGPRLPDFVPAVCMAAC